MNSQVPISNDVRLWPPAPISSIWVLPCPDLDRSIADFSAKGFRLHSLGPADEPSYAVMFVPHPDLPTVVRLDTAPHAAGKREPFLSMNEVASKPTDTPFEPIFSAPSVTAEQLDDDDNWIIGRAGMRYRDLLPGRWGGRFIASHIHVPDGGPVPDYVHFHDVDFQLIFCHRGWVRVVYEDQGDPLVLNPGDAILQAPGIRHRVLESSDDLYVVEISSPAAHPTYVEQDLELPNEQNPGRRYGGQRYVHFVYDEQPWHPSVGARHRTFGLEDATAGRYGARVLEFDPGQAAEPAMPLPTVDSSDFELLVVLNGTLKVDQDQGRAQRLLRPGQSVAVGPCITNSLTVAATSSAEATALLVQRFVL